LYSDNEQKHHIDTILDLGAEDNWMSAKTVEEMGFLKRMEDNNSKPLLDFNNQPLKSTGKVNARWQRRDGRLEEVTFRIVERGPFQALFGYKLLLEKNLVIINDDYPDGGFVLVENMEPSEGA
jgi:hypothetical protein